MSPFSPWRSDAGRTGWESPLSKVNHTCVLLVAGAHTVDLSQALSGQLSVTHTPTPTTYTLLLMCLSLLLSPLKEDSLGSSCSLTNSCPDVDAAPREM